MTSYSRPSFWRMPRNQDDRYEKRQEHKKRVHFKDEVLLGSPAYGEILRGDIISKVEDYDARDLTHGDAQMLFRTSGNKINLVVHRDNKVAFTQNASNDSSRCSSAMQPVSPAPSRASLLSPTPNHFDNPHRAPSPLPPLGAYAAAIESPLDTLPHTVFPTLNASGGYIAPYRPESSASNYSCFSPMPTRDHQQEVAEETDAIVNQPYRTTPLILPGAKVKKDVAPTESYLRHHPNPAIRHAPSHIDDLLMKQKVADTVLTRVVGEDAKSGKIAHKQFNSPIGLYSEGNIENTIKQTVQTSPIQTVVEQNPNSNGTLFRPSKIQGYKKTVVYDPSKSETYRALYDDNLAGEPVTYEAPIVQPVQTKVFHPTRGAPHPVKKPQASFPPPNPQGNNHHNNMNTLGESYETIHQSNSFKRLMHSVLGQTDY